MKITREQLRRLILKQLINEASFTPNPLADLITIKNNDSGMPDKDLKEKFSNFLKDREKDSPNSSYPDEEVLVRFTPKLSRFDGTEKIAAEVLDASENKLTNIQKQRYSLALSAEELERFAQAHIVTIEEGGRIDIVIPAARDASP